jgi:hypothetical protein
MRFATLLTAAAAVAPLLSAVPAHAADEPDADVPSRAEEPPAAPRPGTHFFGELRVGSNLDGVGDFAYGGTLGAGGRLYRLPPIYLIGTLERTGEATFPIGDQVKLTTLTTGLRFYLPIHGPLRLMGELALGGLNVNAQRALPEGTFTESYWLPYAEIALGPQFRVLHELSLGVRASLAFADTQALQSSEFAAGWEPSVGGRKAVHGTMTFHF